MESKAKLAGHPAYPILVVFPLGLLATLVIFDGLYLLHNALDIPAYTRAKQISLPHGAGNTIVLILFGLGWLWRSYEPGYQPTILALICSGLAFLLAALTGWLGANWSTGWKFASMTTQA